MATTSFDKNFSVPKEKSMVFAKVMAQKSSVKNDKGYVSHLVKASDYRYFLKKALGKNT